MRQLGVVVFEQKGKLPARPGTGTAPPARCVSRRSISAKPRFPPAADFIRVSVAAGSFPGREDSGHDCVLRLGPNPRGRPAQPLLSRGAGTGSFADKMV